MKHVPLIAIVSFGAALAVAAEDPKPESTGPSTANPVLAETATSPSVSTTASASTTRGVSAETAARLAALAPKFAPAPSPAPSTTDNPVIKETEDKPKNGIVRLPAYTVREPKMPALSEAQVLTPKGRVQLAYKAFPGLRFGNIWIFRNDAIADAMLEEELMTERAHEIADLMSLLPANQPESDTPRARLIRDALTPRSSPARMDSGSP